MMSHSWREGNSAVPDTSVVLPPSIMPVIILNGSEYQMGYQYGQQLASAIIWQKDAVWAQSLKEFGNREAIIRELKASMHYTKESNPSALDGLKGMADGATATGYELSFIDCLLINAKPQKPTTTAAYPSAAEDEKFSSDGCSSWSSWGKTTKEGKLICAKSSDSEFGAQVTIIAFPEEGNSYLATAQVGELADTPCMNNRGLFIASSGGFAKRPIDFDYGTSTTCGYQHLLRFADNASQAKEMFLRWKYPRCTNIQFSDINGDAYVVEITAALSSIRKSGDFGERDFIYSTNNYFNDEMKESIYGIEFIEHGGWLGSGWSISSISRNLQLWNMLHNYSGQVDLEFAKMIWRFPGNPPPVMIDEKAYSNTRGAGWDQKIGNQFNRRVAIMLPDRGNNGVAYICTGSAGRVVYPIHPGGHCFPIAPTHSFYRITLAASPQEIIEAAKQEAHACIASAHRQLMNITFLDAGYAILNRLFTVANTEFYEGVHFAHQAFLASGNEALKYSSQAATAFARAQAHAKQLQHVFVPPANAPEHLGLKPYGGSWASWAVR